MSSSSKRTAWAYLAAGLLMLFSAARDIWAPGFLSISSRHPSRIDVSFGFVAAIFFLGVACRGFMRMRAAATR
ncbi:MAG TPA: hypothetical protein VHC72_14770 [Bryobacteraceae bacterium]|nr:hypothetical protein [Bryobacteraceae bacterium]